MILAFSSEVWKRPWPNFDAVSMNFSLHPTAKPMLSSRLSIPASNASNEQTEASTSLYLESSNTSA